MGKWLTALEASNIERPVNTPNLYSMMLYADTYVLAEAMRAAGKDLTREGVLKSLDTSIHDFVAGNGGAWSYAHPIGLPRTFTATDHQGNRKVQPVINKAGVFKPAA